MTLSKLLYHNFSKPMWRIKSTIIFLLNNLGLWKIFKSIYSFAPQMILLDHLMCMTPHQGIGSPLSSLLISLFGGAQGRGWRGSMLVLHILQRQKPDPMEKTSHTIKSRCACVWNFSGWNSHPFLHDSIFYFEIWANFLFLFSFPFFFFCFWVRIYFFSCIAHTFLHDEESSQSDGVCFLCGDGRHVSA